MKISRREFCKNVATGATLLSAGSGLSACRGIRRDDLAIDTKTKGFIFGLDQRDEQILNYASLAPSILNIQPWFVRIEDRHQWIIGIDQHRRAPAVDPDNREILLSIGAFVENLSIASAAQGLYADVQVIAASCLDTDIVKINFIYRPPVEYPLERLALRRTVKKGFQHKDLTLETEYALSTPLKDHFFYFSRETEHAACIQASVIEQFHNQLDRENAQQEIVSWMRFSNEDATKHMDGLTIESMEIRGISGWYLRHFADPADFLKPAYREKSLDYTANLAKEGAGWVVITSKDKGVASLIETGRCFEKMALSARELKVGIHPMNQYLEEKSGLNHFLTSHVTEFTPQFILRVGYIDAYPPPVSLRRPFHWFLQD